VGINLSARNRLHLIRYRLYRAFPNRNSAFSRPILQVDDARIHQKKRDRKSYFRTKRHLRKGHKIRHYFALKDFPSATFICSEAALAEIKALKGIKAVKKGILHALFPIDFYERVRTIEDFADKITVSKEGLTTYFLFKNEQFKLVAVHGHAKGMLGFIFETDTKKIFFGTDASWSYDTYNRGILPLKIVKLFFDSWTDFVKTQQKIQAFQDQNPTFNILFTHCEKTLNYISNEI
jgi:hypothetical protein